MLLAILPNGKIMLTCSVFRPRLVYVRVLVSGVLFTSTGFASAAPDCGGRSSSHASERACWVKAAEKSNALVRSAQVSLRERIKNWGEEAGSIERTLVLFDESAKRFNRYRQAQCEFAASTAAGGNGAGDMRLSCQITLNEAYLRSLHEQSVWFSGR